MKVRRFFYVSSPRCTALHLQFGKTHSEGLTACGRVVNTSWRWMRDKPRGAKRCVQCQRAA